MIPPRDLCAQQSTDQRLFLPPRKSHHLPCAGRSGPTPLSNTPTPTGPIPHPLCPSVSIRQMWMEHGSARSICRKSRGRRGQRGGGRPPPQPNCTCYTHEAPAQRRYVHARSPLLPSPPDRVAGRSRPLPGGALLSALPSPERRGELYTRDGGSAFLLPTGAAARNRRSERESDRGRAVTAAATERRASCQRAAERKSKVDIDFPIRPLKSSSSFSSGCSFST